MRIYLSPFCKSTVPPGAKHPCRAHVMETIPITLYPFLNMLRSETALSFKQVEGLDRQINKLIKVTEKYVENALSATIGAQI